MLLYAVLICLSMAGNQNILLSARLNLCWEEQGGRQLFFAFKRSPF